MILSVLIVDDSSTIRKLLEAMLKEMNINVIAKAPSALEGILLYKKYKPDFVTMDVSMPGVSGIEALKKIKKIDNDAKVIMLTSQNNELLAKDAIKNGAKGYILKPLNKDRIKECIDKIFLTKTKSENDNFLIKDPLTGLYTEHYMYDSIQRLIEIHNREKSIVIGLIRIAINNIHEIRTQRDTIIKQIASKIEELTRGCDYLVSLPDNEFGIFVVGSATQNMDIIAKKIK